MKRTKRTKCEHVCSKYTYVNDVAIARHCEDCGERLSLGPSNDVGVEVEIEIRAAEFVAMWMCDVNNVTLMSDVEFRGWCGGVASQDLPEWQVGNLTRCIIEHDISSDAGPTDFADPAWSSVTTSGPRPDDLGGATLAEPPRDAIGAIEERIAEQTRHDVAASVARHADITSILPISETAQELVDRVCADSLREMEKKP